MSTSFQQTLEVVEQLSVDEQETLIDIVRRRLADQGRKRIARDVVEARDEQQAGQGKKTTVEDLMKEILS
jgi:hypothetical protein